MEELDAEFINLQGWVATEQDENEEGTEIAAGREGETVEDGNSEELLERCVTLYCFFVIIYYTTNLPILLVHQPLLSP
jgi:hypothetical protein